MNNVSILHDTRPHFLEGIRQRLGASSGSDQRCDEEINLMTGRELAEKWAGWSLGDEAWATDLFTIIDAIQNTG